MAPSKSICVCNVRSTALLPQSLFAEQPEMPPSSTAPTGYQLNGLVERVTFFSEETGFCVLRVKAEGHRDLVTVIGSAPSVSAGEWITAEGDWVIDKEHGRQLKAFHLKTMPPNTREGLEKYLASGMVKGIGPIYAKRLVERFGEELFEVIEKTPNSLQQIEGIGPKRKAKIASSWVDQLAIRQIMLFLHSHGLSTSRSVRIHKTYGAEAIERIRHNPYLLAKDIRGIGFKTADVVAQKLGIALDSPYRACAGVEHILLEATQEGHCALPTADLLTKASELLAVDPLVVESALAGMLTKGDLILEAGSEGLIFLPYLVRAEKEIARRIARLSGLSSVLPPFDFERAVAWCEERTRKQLAESQRQALGQVLENRLSVITGGPGVGKTTLIHSLLTIVRAKKIRCLLTAPTGRAAKRLTEATGLEAKTIHRLLEVQPGSGRFARNENSPLDCDLLVIDETSMVDVPLMNDLLRALPANANLVLVGDVDQLPSVGPGTVLRDIIESGVAPVVRLTEIFRQAAHSQIVTTAHRVKNGEMPERHSKETDSDFYFLPRDDPEQTRDLLVELVARRIPAKLALDPIRDIQVLCPMNRGSVGARELNERLQAALNPLQPGEIEVERFGFRFRRRDKVIQTENNYDKEVFNGDIGQIESIDAGEREITIRYDTRQVTYDYGELDEVALAYAISIHKSQGSEFSVVVIPLAMQQYMLLERNLIYTGITRGKKLVVLAGEAKALGIAIRKNNTHARHSGLLSRLQQFRDARAN
jgi:exodeoxyribonuclease V alpha subunit